MGVGFSMMSVFGVVALSGVVVNSSLVLVHYVGQKRQQGEELIEAVKAAGTARFKHATVLSATSSIPACCGHVFPDRTIFGFKSVPSSFTP